MILAATSNFGRAATCSRFILRNRRMYTIRKNSDWHSKFSINSWKMLYLLSIVAYFQFTVRVIYKGYLG